MTSKPKKETIPLFAPAMLYLMAIKVNVRIEGFCTLFA